MSILDDAPFSGPSELQDSGEQMARNFMAGGLGNNSIRQPIVPLPSPRSDLHEAHNLSHAAKQVLQPGTENVEMPKGTTAVLVAGVMVQLRIPNVMQGYDCRIHIFLNVVEYIPHNHARPFASLLLKGSYIQKTWEVEPINDGEEAIMLKDGLVTAEWQRQRHAMGVFWPTQRMAVLRACKAIERKEGDTMIHGTKTVHTVEALPGTQSTLHTTEESKKEAKDEIRRQVMEGTMEISAITFISRPIVSDAQPASMWVFDNGAPRPPNEAEERLDDECARKLFTLVRKQVPIGVLSAQGEIHHYS